MQKTKKYEKEFFITPNDKQDVHTTKVNMERMWKEYTEDIFSILKANFDKSFGKISYVKNKNGKLATIKIQLNHLSLVSLGPVSFEVRLLYREGSGPCIEVIAREELKLAPEFFKEFYANFQFELFERNFINMLMAWYNDKTEKPYFNLNPNKYNWERYLLYEPLTSGK